MAKNNYKDYSDFVGKKIQIKTDKIVFNISEMKLETNGLMESKILGIVLINSKWYFILKMNKNEITEKVPCKDFVGKIDSIYFLSKKEKNMDNKIKQDEIEIEDDESTNNFLCV